MRRDTREKIVVAIDEITTKLGEILETIQADLYAKAKAVLDDHISSAVTMDEMKDAVSEKKGFVKAMWPRLTAGLPKIPKPHWITAVPEKRRRLKARKENESAGTPRQRSQPLFQRRA